MRTLYLRNDQFFHDSNLGSMMGNARLVLKGHLTYTMPPNKYIKRTSYLKIRGILKSSNILCYSKLLKLNDSSKLLINNVIPHSWVMPQIHFFLKNIIIQIKNKIKVGGVEKD